MIAYNYISSTWEVEEDQEYEVSLSCIVFEAGLGSMKPCLRKPQGLYFETWCYSVAKDDFEFTMCCRLFLNSR